MKNQSLSRLALFIKLLFISVSLLLLAAIFTLFSFDYESFVQIVLLKYGKPEQAEKLKASYLTPATFTYLRYGSLLVAGLIITIFILLRNKIPQIALAIYETYSQFFSILKKISAQIRELSGAEKIILTFFFVVLAIVRTFCLFKFPMVNDEVYSYLYFVDKGFLVSASYYPAPNSHVFFSELCVFTDIFFNDPLLVMRLPSLVSGLLTTFLLFIVVKRKFSFDAALLAAAIFSFSFNVFYYAIHGRGYTLLALFVLISWVSMLHLIEKDSKRIYRMLYVVSGVLGFYTIPVFLYPFASLVFFWLVYLLYYKKSKKLKEFFILNTSIVVLVMVLYSPVFLVSGLEAVIGNKWVKPLSSEIFWQSIRSYFINVANYLWDISSGGFIATLFIFVTGIVVLMRKKENALAGSILFIVLLPVLFLMIQKLQPFFRVWDYLLLFFSLLIALSLKELVDLIRAQRIRYIAVTTITLFVFLFHFKVVVDYLQRGFPYYAQLNTFVDQVFREDFKKVYVPDETYKLFMEFNARKKNKKVELYTGVLAFPELIVVDKVLPFPSEIDSNGYKSYIFNEYIHSYMKK